VPGGTGKIEFAADLQNVIVIFGLERLGGRCNSAPSRLGITETCCRSAVGEEQEGCVPPARNQVMAAFGQFTGLSELAMPTRVACGLLRSFAISGLWSIMMAYAQPDRISSSAACG